MSMREEFGLALLLDITQIITTIGNNSHVAIKIVDSSMAHPGCDLFAEVMRGFQLFSPMKSRQPIAKLIVVLVAPDSHDHNNCHPQFYKVFANSN
jgi:hypothetical protein